MKLNSFVTVADATKVKVYMKNFGEFYNNQIEAAGTIILSRTQKHDARRSWRPPWPCCGRRTRRRHHHHPLGRAGRQGHPLRH